MKVQELTEAPFKSVAPSKVDFPHLSYLWYKSLQSFKIFIRRWSLSTVSHRTQLLWPVILKGSVFILLEKKRLTKILKFTGKLTIIQFFKLMGVNPSILVSSKVNLVSFFYYEYKSLMNNTGFVTKDQTKPSINCFNGNFEKLFIHHL